MRHFDLITFLLTFNEKGSPIWKQLLGYAVLSFMAGFVYGILYVFALLQSVR